MTGSKRASPPLRAIWHKQAKAAAKAKIWAEGGRKPQQPAKTQEEEDQQYQKPKLSDEDRKHQQRVLDVFRNTFGDVLDSPDFTTTLQSVKQALFDRDFAKAFGDAEHLAVYAARWSPTRALGYASVLHEIREHLEPLLSSSTPSSTIQADDSSQEDGTTSTKPLQQQQPQQQLKVISIGGGAAEVVALGSFLSQHPSKSDPLSGTITLLDSGPWETAITQLNTALTTLPPLSKYASAAAKLSNAAMVAPSQLTSTFIQQDVLTLDKERLTSLVAGDRPSLITLLFTLNELFTASGIGKTTAFLLDLTSTLPFGSLMLVVDSPGSYSETSVGKEAKRYPMQWLLDRIMLGTRREPVNGRRWAKLETQDSAWFRLGDIDYPIALENMRYQMHLYRVEDASLAEEVEEED